MTKRIIKIDATSLKKSACGLQFYYTVVDGYRAKLMNNDVWFGIAFHAYVAAMRRTGGNFAVATKAALDLYRRDMIIKPQKKYMTENYLLKVCQDFWFQIGEKDEFVTLTQEVKCDHNDGFVNPDGMLLERVCTKCHGTGTVNEPMVEMGFQWPIYEDDELAVMVAGTIDDVCLKQRGAICLRDYKTTSSYDKKAYMDQYFLSSQLMIYRLTLRKYAEMYPDSIFAEIEKQNPRCFIEGIFCCGAEKPVEFMKSDVFEFKRSQLDDLETLLKRKVLELVAVIKAGKLPLREGMLNDTCSGKFGHLCDFFDACRAPDIISAQHILRRNFVQISYDPLKFNE